MMAKHYRRLRTAVELQRLMQWHYASAARLRLGKPLAWVTSGAPIEILRTMNISAVYPENYGALCGARQSAVSLCQMAESGGYSLDLCSYAKTSLGSLAAGAHAPLGGMPRPDLLVACNNICGTVIKWYEAVALHYQVPLFVLDTPFLYDEPQLELHRYVAAQLDGLVRFIQDTTGHRLNLARLRETVRISNQAVALWSDIRALCKSRPSPLNAPDLFVNMAPIVVLRGRRSAVWFYQRLKAEVEERVRAGVSAVGEERHRLLWDNIAIWHHLYPFFNAFASYGACFVTDTYTAAWSEMIDEADPLQGLAQTYAGVFLNRNLEYRAERMVRQIVDYGADAFVMHCNRSCKPYSLGQYALRRLVAERAGVPGLVVESDMCDSRSYSEGAVQTRIQAFMESLEGRA